MQLVLGAPLVVEDLAQRHQPVVLAGLAQVKRAARIVLRALDQAGADGVQFHVQDGLEHRIRAAEEGRTETLAPEVAFAVEGAVVPAGEGALDVAHELGDVKEPPLKALPFLLGPGFEGFAGVGVEGESTIQEFVAGQRAGRVEAADAVPVIAHDVYRGELAAEDVGVVLDEFEEFEAGQRVGEGEFAVSGGGAGAEVVGAAAIEFQAGHAGHEEESFLLAHDTFYRTH